MIKIKEMKMSVHRKYTKNYQSYGFRIGIMVDVDGESPETAHEKVAQVLDKMTEIEDRKIFAIIE